MQESKGLKALDILRLRIILLSRREVGMNLSEKVAILTQNEGIKRFGLEDKAAKVLLKMFELFNKDKEAFYSFAKIRNGFKSVTSEDLRIILAELEACKMILTEYRRTQFYYKFNDDPTKWTENINFDTATIAQLQQQTRDKIKKKIDRAKKVLEVYDEEALSKQPNLPRTARELHLAKECDPNTCKICAFGIEV